MCRMLWLHHCANVEVKKQLYGIVLYLPTLHGLCNLTLFARLGLLEPLPAKPSCTPYLRLLKEAISLDYYELIPTLWATACFSRCFLLLIICTYVLNFNFYIFNLLYEKMNILH